MTEQQADKWTKVLIYDGPAPVFVGKYGLHLSPGENAVDVRLVDVEDLVEHTEAVTQDDGSVVQEPRGVKGLRAASDVATRPAFRTPRPAPVPPAAATEQADTPADGRKEK